MHMCDRCRKEEADFILTLKTERTEPLYSAHNTDFYPNPNFHGMMAAPPHLKLEEHICKTCKGIVWSWLLSQFHFKGGEKEA